jgi:hypothetical protein
MPISSSVLAAKKTWVISFIFLIVASSVIIYFTFLTTTKKHPEAGTLYVSYFPTSPDTSKSNILYRPTTVRSDSRGNVFVLDAGNHRIMEFAQDGRFLKQIGHIGQGPGDLLRPVDFVIDKGDYLYVLEDGNKRISIFDSDGCFRKAFPIRYGYTPFSICVKGDGKIMVNIPFVGGPLFYLFDQDGHTIDSLSHTETFENPPFKGANSVATEVMNEVRARFNSRGEFFVVYVSRPLFRRFNANGDLIVEKTIDGPEIDSIRARAEDIRKRHPPANPSAFIGVSFIDDVDLIDDDNMLLRLRGIFAGEYTSFYHVDARGNVIKRYHVKNSTRIKERFASFSRFCLLKGGRIIASDTYNGILFSIDSIPGLPARYAQKERR